MPASSTNDNRLIRDGNSNLFTNRMKDISSAQDGTMQRSLVLASPYPVDYGVGGSYMTVLKSGSMAAGLAANAPIYSMRHDQVTPTVNALVRRIWLTAWTLGTGFTAGIATFELYVARSFSASDTGGTAITNPSRMRGSMAASQLIDHRCSSTATLTAGTRTLDSQPFASLVVGVGTATNSVFCYNQPFTHLSDHHPLVLADTDGIVIQATVPATGVWSFNVNTEWDEVGLVLF